MSKKNENTPITFTRKEITELSQIKPKHLVLQETGIKARPEGLYYLAFDNSEAFVVTMMYGPRYIVETPLKNEDGFEDWTQVGECANLQEVALCLNGKNPKMLRTKEVFETEVKKFLEANGDYVEGGEIVLEVLGAYPSEGNAEMQATYLKGRRWLTEMQKDDMLIARVSPVPTGKRGKRPLEFAANTPAAAQARAAAEAEAAARNQTLVEGAEKIRDLIAGESHEVRVENGQIVLTFEALAELQKKLFPPAKAKKEEPKKTEEAPKKATKKKALATANA